MVIGIEIPGAVLEEVVNHLVSKGYVSPELINNDKRWVAEVPAEMWCEAIFGHDDDERRRGSLNPRAGGYGSGVKLKVARGVASRHRFTEPKPVLPLSVESPSVAMVGVCGFFISTAAARQDDKKNKLSHVGNLPCSFL